MGYHCLLPGIFLTQGSNPGLLHCRQILYPLSHQGSPALARRFQWDRHQEALSGQRWAVLCSSRAPHLHLFAALLLLSHCPWGPFFLSGSTAERLPYFSQALPGALISFLECPLPMISWCFKVPYQNHFNKDWVVKRKNSSSSLLSFPETWETWLLQRHPQGRTTSGSIHLHYRAVKNGRDGYLREDLPKLSQALELGFDQQTLETSL